MRAYMLTFTLWFCRRISRKRNKHVRLLAPFNPRFIRYKWTVTLWSKTYCKDYIFLTIYARFTNFVFIFQLLTDAWVFFWKKIVVSINTQCTTTPRKPKHNSIWCFFFHKNSDEDNKRITCLFGCSIKSNAILMLPSRCTVLNEGKNHLLSNRKQFFSYFKFREKTRLFCEWSNNCVIS